MKFPSLVLKQFQQTPVSLVIEREGIGEDGQPLVAATYNGLCNYQSCSKRIYTDKETYVEVTGKCLFDGDICPDVLEISSGEAAIFGESRRILSGRKARNPDGSVNYTEVCIG